MTRYTLSWEQAVRHCMDDPAMAELARGAYFGDPVASAQRYRDSAEFAEVKRILPGTKGRALDLGAGNGILSWALAAEGWDVTAVEPDPSDLVGAGAIRALSDRTATPITVIEAFGEAIPLDAAGFDLVVARQVLHHAHDLTGFCAEMARSGRASAASSLRRRERVHTGRLSQRADQRRAGGAVRNAVVSIRSQL
jgi:2-polyprenyl-3-methyl-5-hydroxy-6-metoxy-1,4-benzoquinol methylase